ncbi:hypothetical protein AB0L34_10355 [Micromonospora sp. NPDC052213]
MTDPGHRRRGIARALVDDLRRQGSRSASSTPTATDRQAARW